MEKYYNKVLHNIEDSINLIGTKSDFSIQSVETLIVIIIQSLSNLREYVQKMGFKSTVEEIYFFKYQKPAIVSKLIYYNSVYKIETNKPKGTKLIEKYLNDELKKLKSYFDKNLEFYEYYRAGSTYLDEKYFLRGKYDIKSGIDTHYLVADPAFSTSHGYMVARIMANDMLQVYLEVRLHQNHQKNDLNNTTLNWTGNKTDLTELIYALHAQGVFNNGNADIKLIAKTFENIFNIDIGDFYHTFMELKSRKINYTKFLDKLHDTLIRKMEEWEQ